MKHQALTLTAVMMASLALPGAARAGDSYWQAGTGDWSTGTNWTNGEPGGYDWAYINNGGTAEITQSGEECRYLYLGDDSGQSGHVQMSSGSLTADWYEYIGRYGTGTFTQTGGTNTISSDLYLGYWSGSSGTYELSGTGLLSADYEYIGFGGTGTFTQTGGTNMACGLCLGFESGSGGTYTISGGGLAGGSVYVGNDIYGGEGTFKVLGHDALMFFDSYTQAASGDLYSIFDSDGLGLIAVFGIAELAGDWYIEDPGADAPFGTFDVLTAGGGILGSFSNVYLPNADWSWGIDGGTLWIEHVPEPATLSILAIGGLAMLRRKRK